MASATVSFTKSEYTKNTTIKADFSWLYASFEYTHNAYAILYLNDPDNTTRKTYKESILQSGTKQLSITADKIGTWKAFISYFNGSTWQIKYATVHVVDEVVPPPGPSIYNVTFHTTPGNCTISLNGSINATSNSTGFFRFFNLPSMRYDWVVSKDGYLPNTGTFYLTKNIDVYTTLEVYVEPPPPEVTCTPGERKCEGEDLFQCNQEGTGWDLVAADSPVCEGQQECPDFWTDPVGAVLCWIISSWEAMLGLVQGGFESLLYNTNNFIKRFSTDISSFINDPLGKLQQWTQDAFVTTQNLLTNITSGINDWWTGVSTDVQTWITNAITPISSWIDGNFNSITDWWSSVKDTIGSWFSDIWSNAQSFWSDINSNISQWWTTTSSSVTQWINNAVDPVKSWLDTTFTNIGNWWDDTKNSFSQSIHGWIDDALSWVDDNFTNFTNWLGQLPGDVSDFIGTQINGVIEYLDETIPTVVGGMFEWAKPIVKPIQDAVGFLENISSVFTGTSPQDERITEHAEAMKKNQEEIESILGR